MLKVLKVMLEIGISRAWCWSAFPPEQKLFFDGTNISMGGSGFGAVIGLRCDSLSLQMSY